jgi:hypothetical protein
MEDDLKKAEDRMRQAGNLHGQKEDKHLLKNENERNRLQDELDEDKFLDLVGSRFSQQQTHKETWTPKDVEDILDDNLLEDDLCVETLGRNKDQMEKPISHIEKILVKDDLCQKHQGKEVEHCSFEQHDCQTLQLLQRHEVSDYQQSSFQPENYHKRNRIADKTGSQTQVLQMKSTQDYWTQKAGFRSDPSLQQKQEHRKKIQQMV